jgi:PAS domain S-box-containing protein
VWAGINLNAQADAEGRPLRLLAAIEDITPRKLVEAEQRRLTTAVEQAAEAIVITDTAPHIVYVNPAFERISGYSKAEVLGRNPRMLKSGLHDAEFYQRMWTNLRSGVSWSGLMVNKRKDGTLYYEEATISPVFDAAGRPVNYVAVKRDVTYERQVEEQFRLSQKLEAIGQLAGGIAHDFNNILSVIKGHAELLEAAPSPSAVRESADEISRAANKAAGLTRQLLLFSRRQPLQLTPADLNDIVSNMRRMLERILGEDIAVEFRYAAGALPVVVDTGMMDQVLLNLAVNSRDAMPRGGRLEIHTGSKAFADGAHGLPSTARPGTYACLTVIDSGAGIPAEVLPHVFEPFFTTKEVGKGTGLGLATVLGIVQQHDGWLDVRSQVGKGTTVHVFIPRAAAPAGRAEPVRVSSMPGGEETILLVEDDVALRRLVRSILASLGYRVLEASSGRDALGVWTLHQQEIKLLLTDLVMPDGMSGLELARLLLGHNPELRVIYSSGYSPDIAGHEVALREGTNFLTKPYSPQALAETVRARLSDPD